MKRMDDTKKILPSTVLRAYKKGFGYTALTVLDNNEYFIAVSADEDFFSAVRDGDSLELYLWVEEVASYEFNSLIIGRTMLGKRILLLEHSFELQRTEGRKCLAAEVDIPLTFFTFSSGTKEKSVSSEDISFLKGQIILLQDREAVLKSSKKLKEGCFIKGALVLDGSEIELIGKIEELNEEKNIYNVIFSGVHDKSRIQILDYIFRIYREF